MGRGVRSVLVFVGVVAASVVVDANANASSAGQGAEPPAKEISISFTGNCNTRFAESDTQECHGNYAAGGSFVPFCCSSEGTTRSTLNTTTREVEVVILVQGGEMRGTIPRDSSNRYAVRKGIIGSSIFFSENASNVPAGQEHGPLDLNVQRGRCDLLSCTYTFSVHGWIIGPFKDSSSSEEPRPDPDPTPDAGVDIDVFGLDAVTIDIDNQDHPHG